MQKIFVIVPVNYEYNDEHHWEEGFGEPLAAFRDQAKAELALEAANREDVARYEIEDQEGNPLNERFVLRELEVSEELVEGQVSGKGLLEKKRELEGQMDALREQVRANGRGLIREALAPVFEQFAELRAVRWTQYTPYFNDGAACRFGSSHADYSSTLTEEDGDFEDGDDRFDGPVTKALSAFSDDDMEAIFGDHVEVTVSRTGEITVEEYEHD